MSSERWERTKQILEEALFLAPGKRSEYLAAACGEDADLRSEVESLVASHEEAGSQFLDGAAPQILGLVPQFSPVNSRAGQSVGSYKILEEIGRGGMGVVYKAEDSRLHRLVALKFLPGEIAATSTSFERFEREAQAASALDHPNICSIYQLGEHEDQPFIVMQLLDGQTLREWIETSVIKASAGGDDASRLRELLEIAVQIADGLEAAHGKGIIHRDIKPANIFITSRGQVKILDFGIAKYIDAAELAQLGEENENGEDAGFRDLHLTRTGVSLGTPSYLSPEQFRREKLDARTDLFSFGLVLYEMATGERAFPGTTATLIREAVLNAPEISVRRINPRLPVELDAVIARAIAKDRQQRYQTAAELRADLLGIQRAVDPVRSGVFNATAPFMPKVRKMLRRTAAPTVAVLAFGVIALFLHYRMEQARRLNEKDTLVLADFANSTNDTVFDGTLKQALSVALNQSPFLNILPESKVRSTLKLMTKPPDASLSRELASEVCQRSGSKAYIAGAIAALGTEYVIGLKAENCQVGELLAEEQVTAKSKDDVIAALGSAASHLRQKLGESTSSLKKFDVPLREATTGSLDALKQYTLSGQVQDKSGSVAAIPFDLKAVALDPLFAVAYGSLAMKYLDAGENLLAAKYAAKAYELRGRATPLEQVRIEADYHSSVTGNLAKTADAYRRWGEIRPRSPNPHDNLSFVYGQLGQHENSLAESLLSLRLAPHGAAYFNAGFSNVLLGRLADAKAIIAQAESHNMNMPPNHASLYLIAFLEHDPAAMEREAAAAADVEGVEDTILYYQSNTAASSGQLTKALDFSRRASVSALRGEQKETAKGYQVDVALREALFGNKSEAKRRLVATLGASNGPDVQAAAALAFAFAGDQSQAQKLADDLVRSFPENTLVQSNYLPAIRGQLAVNSEHPEKALELLKAARPVELGQPAQALMLNLYPVFVRGNAYLAAGDGRAAQAEFQELLDHPGIVLNEPIGVLAHLGLARAYTLQGDTAKAKGAYQTFLTLWKDADPNVPALRQAKAEYAKLH